MTDQAGTTQPVEVYSAAARAFHWLTALGIAMLIASGLWMTARSDANIWDATTNALYSGHKLLGFVVLWLVVARLVYRLVRGAPDDAPSLSPAQRVISHVVHWSLYGLLLMIPILGWLGVSAFPALTVFGVLDLPSIAVVDQAQAKQYFEWHKLAGRVMFGLLVLHIGAALLHAIVLRDGVFQRMTGGAGAQSE